MKGVILFVLEGASDETAIMPFITEELKKLKIRVTVKIVHGDILTKYENGVRNFEVIPANVKGKIKTLILDFLKTPSIKSDGIRLKDISKIYYVTDTDNCFLLDKAHSKNKSACLKRMFNFSEIEMSKHKVVNFDTLFFAKDLENVIVNSTKKLTDKEKEIIALEFAFKSMKNREYFINTFRDPKLKTWDNYRTSYKEIQTHSGRACNINNLLDEIEKWK